MTMTSKRLKTLLCLFTFFTTVLLMANMSFAMQIPPSANPEVTDLSPADNSTTVGVNDNLVITFDKAVNVQSGLIRIKKSSDFTTYESIDVTSGQVTGGGTNTITIDPPVTLEGETAYFVQIPGTAFEDLSGNSFAGISDSSAWNFTTSESINPSVTTLSPSDGATGVGANDNLVITFDEAVNIEAGNIVIKKASDDTTFESIDVTSGKVTGDGTATITVNPAGTFESETAYYVEIGASAFDDISGNSFAGISDKTTWNFSVPDIQSPSISTLSPSDGATGVGTSDNLVITFDEVINVGTGNILIRKSSDDTTFETIDVTSGQVTGTGTTTITINPAGDFSAETAYYVQIPGTVFDDLSGNSFAGIIDTSTWNFTTIDITSPSVSTLSPSDGATSVGANDNLVITFDEAVNVETGNIVIKKASDDTTFESIDVTSSKVTGDGTATITVNPTGTFESEIAYYVEIEASAFDDVSSNSFAGISDKTTWNFSVPDIQSPSVSTLSPSDGATGVGTSDNLVITFDEAVNVETGNIVIKKASDDTTFESIDVTGGKVTGDGTTTITINPAGTFSNETAYYVQIAGTAFDDLSGNSYAGISDTSTWNFTTPDTVSPLVSSLTPSNHASNVGVNSNWVITFNEAVNVETGNIVIKKLSDDTSFESIDVTSSKVTGDGTATITINPSGTLDNNTGYYLQIESTAFDDLSGNSFAGINDKTTWSVTSELDTTAPLVSSLSPSNNVINASLSNNLVITFNEAVNLETGHILIKKSSDDSLVESIDVTSGQVTGDGTNSISINPSSNFTNSTAYYVEIEGSAIDDLAGNSYLGMSDSTSWHFTTIAPTPTPSDQSNNTSNETPNPPVAGVPLVINGSEVDLGNEEIEIENGQKKVSININSEVINQKVQETTSNNEENVLQVVAQVTDANTLDMTLNGELVKKMEDKSFVVSIQVDDIIYDLPAKEVGIENVANNMGIDSTDLVDIDVAISIKQLSPEQVNEFQTIANSKGYELVLNPVEFEVIATSNLNNMDKKTVNITRFNQYVERTFKVPEGIDPNQVTTGIVFNEDGGIAHIPSFVFEKDGVYYVKLSSLTNSKYSILWNDISVSSVEHHWSKEIVNDMARRLIIEEVDHFKPDAAISRAEFTDYITKAIGIYRTGDVLSTKFSDVDVNNQFVNAIQIAADYGIVSGYGDGTFKPDANISREEAMMIYSKAMTIIQFDGPLQGDKLKQYSDENTVSTWAYKEVEKVVNAGLFSGKSLTTLNPHDTFTKAEAAASIKNMLIQANLINQ